MKIGIDARFVGPQGTGLGKYSEKLILNLAKIDKKNQYVIFLQKNNWNFLKVPENFTKTLANISWYSLEEQLKMPRIFEKENLDILHVPHFNVPILYNRKFIITIHDLIHHEFKKDAATTRNPIIFKLKRFAYQKVIEKAIKKSQKIIVPSNFVKGQIIKKFNVVPIKLVVTYEAAEEEYSQQSTVNIKPSTLLEKFSIRKPFIIYVGNAYPHKNLENLLEAMKLLTDNHPPVNTHLMIVCARDVFAHRLDEKIKKLNLSNHVTLTGYIEATNLSQIFKSAQAYVFPSLSEGFGIPGLNAMAANLPLIASNIPTLKEIYGEAALYFDPKDPKDIAEKISKVLMDSKIKSDLIKKGSEQVKKYSWLQMAQETLKIYETFK